MALPRVSVARTVILALVTVTTLLLLCVGAMNYLSVTKWRLVALREDLSSEVDQLATALAISLWDVDEAQIGKIMESTMRHRSVSGIVVAAPGILLSMGRNAQWGIDTAPRDLPKDGSLSEERPILHGDTEIGRVRLYLTSRFVEAETRRTLVLSLVAVVLLDLTLVLCLYFFLWRLVLRPLKAVSRYAVAVSGGGQANPPLAGRGFRGELEELRFSMQEMVALLETRYAEARAAEERYRDIFENAIEGIFQTSPDGRFIAANPAMARMLGYDSPDDIIRMADDMPRQLFADSGGRHEFMRLMDQGMVRRLELQAHRKDGTEIWLAVSGRAIRGPEGTPLRYEGTVEDITERKIADGEKARLQQQLAQAQKMESLGRLAGGVAHDFNNILTTILGFASLAMEDLHETDPKRAQLGQIQKSAERAANLTGQLLAFSRKQVIEPTVLDLNWLIANTEKMLTRLIREDVRLELVLARPLGMIRADRGQIEQILINLLVNPRDAMPDGGLIRIETANIALNERFALQPPKPAPGDYVVLTVSDTGFGMTPEVQAHLFEPFFTTKSPGKGTGLGMATVYGAVQQNRGAIEVRSEVGAGTTFRVFFPRFLAEPDSQYTAEIDVTMPRGSETILFAEDDDAVRDFTVTVLRRLGYRILACTNAGEALQKAGELADPIHLLITDVVMPGMNGQALARSLVALRPGLPCLLISGYAGDMAISDRPEAGMFFLSKPFTAMSLAQKVREAIGGAEGEQAPR